MNRVIINLEALFHNYKTIQKWMSDHGARWSTVTKVLCGHKAVLEALAAMGVNTVGDSRLSNLRTVKKLIGNTECWYLRVPGPSVLEQVVQLSDVSLNSEIETISALNDAAGKHGLKHHVVIMIELGDLREGILPGSLITFYESVFNLPNIKVLGIGANLGCLAGVAPNIDQFMQLALYRELLELKFERKLQLISAGSSAALPLVLNGTCPKSINHFRIGESLFLGTDLINGGKLPGLRDDVMLLRTEIAELKEKSLSPPMESSNIAPFSEDQTADPQPGQRGYRALIGVGHLDTDISGLVPLNPEYEIAGASSDITVVNLGDHPDGLKVGDAIEFRMNYAALLRLMNCRYIDKAVTPSLDEFKELARAHYHPQERALEIPGIARNLSEKAPAV